MPGMTSTGADRETLRALADDGNAKALDRLADLADERGDLDELEGLLDEGSTHAGRLLTRRAAAAGDLRRLQSLTDAGSAEAATALDRLLDPPPDRPARHRFLTIGYGDRAGYDRTDPAVRDGAHAHDARLRAAGMDAGIAGTPVQVRNHDAAGVRVADGPYLSSALPVAGFAIIEAASLAEAIEMVSGTPCAVAHGVVEVWPLEG